MHFKWVQLIHTIPNIWKQIIKLNKGRSRNFCEFNPHLIFKASMYTIDKLTSQTIYKILITKIKKPPTSQKLLLNMLQRETLPWKDIHNLPRITTIDTYTRVFQY